MTEFHQLQGRFDLAPLDARSGEKTYPFERGDDPVSLATRYKMMNDRVLQRQSRESKKLKRKLDNFRTTKAEIYRVLADDGAVEPRIARDKPTDKSIYSITGRRPPPPKGLNEKETGHFEDLKERFRRNQKAIKQLQERLLELAGGEANVRAREKGEDVAMDPEAHAGWSVISLGTKVQVFCQVGKSLGHTKTNFVRSGTVVYFDAVSVEEAIRLSQEHGDNGAIDALKKVKKQSKLLRRLHRDGESLEGKSGVASERRLLDMTIAKETKIFKKLEKECFVGNYNSKRHARKHDNTYGVLYQDNELEFGVARSRMTIVTSKSMEMSLAHVKERKEEEEKLCKFKPPQPSKPLKLVSAKDPETGEDKVDEDGNPICVVAPSRLARIMERKEVERLRRLKKSNDTILQKKKDIRKATNAAEKRERHRKAIEEDKKRKEKEKRFKKSQEHHEKRRERNRLNLEKLGIDPNLSKEERAAKLKVIEDAKLKKKQDKVKVIRKKAEKRMEEEEARKEAMHKARHDKEKQRMDRKKAVDKAMLNRTKRHANMIDGKMNERAKERADDHAKLLQLRLDAKNEKVDAHNKELVKNIQDAESHLSNCKNKLASLMKDIDAAKASIEHSFDLTPQQDRIEIDAKDLIGRKKAMADINTKINKLAPLMRNLLSAMEKFKRVNQYFFYAVDNRDILDELHPKWKVAQVSKLLEQLWERLDKKWDKAETKKLKKIFNDDIPSKRKYWDQDHYPLDKERMKLYETSEDIVEKCRDRLQSKEAKKAERAIATQWKPPLPRKRDHFLQQAFKLLDLNGDECISKSEFVAGKQNLQVEKLLKQSVCLRVLIDAVEDDFADWDGNNDGVVDWDEIKAFVEEKNKAAAKEICYIVFDELDSDESGIIELDKALQQISTANKELKAEFESNAVGRHLLTPSVRRSALMALEETNDDELMDEERQVSKKGFIELLAVALQHADNDYIVYRTDEEGNKEVYSIANNIKDWEKMKKIVDLKNKERALAKFHKERTPESEDMSEEQKEKFLEEVAKKEKANLLKSKKKIKAKERRARQDENRRRKEKKDADKLKTHLKNGVSKLDVRKALLRKSLDFS